MKLEDALRILKIQITEHAPGPPKYRMGEMGRKVRVFKTITRPATPEDILSYNESTGVLVTCDGRKYSIY